LGFFDKLLHTANVVGTPGSGFVPQVKATPHFGIQQPGNVEERMKRLTEKFKV